MSKQTPAVPDYTGAAEATAASSRDVTEQQTWANRPTLNTPFGQQTWEVKPTWDPTTQTYLNSWTMNTNLTPESQRALDSQMALQQGRSDLAEGLLGRVQDEYGEPMDWDQFTELNQGPDAGQYGAENIQRSLDTSGLQDIDPSQRYYDDAGDAIYNQFSSRAEPQFTRDTEALRTQLYNQGLREGDEAFDREIEKQRQSQGDARQQASYQATIGAGEEAQRMFGMDSGTRAQQFGERSGEGAFYNSAADQALRQRMAAGGQEFSEGQQAANQQNTIRQQQIAEEMQRRGFSLNEIQALLSGQQVSMPGMPSFNSANRSSGTDYSGAARDQFSAGMDVFNAQQQALQGAMQGAGSMAMMFSDRRLKMNVQKSFKDLDGIQWYRYQYIVDGPDGEIHVGVMADELEKVRPDCVLKNYQGYKMVDYGRLLGQSVGRGYPAIDGSGYYPGTAGRLIPADENC